MNNTTSRVFLYARKSTDSEDRQVRSIPDQLSELRTLAVRENLDVVTELIESQTAKKPGRPIFNDMLARLAAGEADGILAWHPDRLARNAVDGGQILHLVDNGIIRMLKFPTFWFEPTSQGKLMLQIMFGQSKYYVDSLSENIKRGQRNKLKRGLWPMVAPIGYLNSPDRQGIIPDPERSAHIAKTFELYATGEYTIDRLAGTMTASGLTNRHGEPLSRAMYHRLLQNPIYSGILTYGGEQYEGKHTPLVTLDLFKQCQERLSNRCKPKSPALKPYLYRGMFRCGECGCRITSETHKGINYLRCTKRKGKCSQPYVREEIITGQIQKSLQQIAIPGEWIAAMLAEVESDVEGERAASRARIEVCRKKIATFEEKLRQLVTTYVDGELPISAYRQVKQRLLENKQKESNTLADLEKHQKKPFEPLLARIRSLREPLFLIESNVVSSSRDFLLTHGSNLTIRNGKLRYEWQGMWGAVVAQGFSGGRAQPAFPPDAFHGENSSHALVVRRIVDVLRLLLRPPGAAHPERRTSICTRGSIKDSLALPLMSPSLAS